MEKKRFLYLKKKIKFKELKEEKEKKNMKPVFSYMKREENLLKLTKREKERRKEKNIITINKINHSANY